MVTVIDYGLGNLASIANILRKVGAEAEVTSDLTRIRQAERLVLPGVGAFDAGRRSMIDRGLDDVLREKVLGQKTPLLGICLGMQLLTRRSDEGNIPGLGLVDADVIRFAFPSEAGLKVPHMGWNDVRTTPGAALFRSQDEAELPRFYFVHSYYVVCNNADDVSGISHYGQDFVSAFQKDHIFGVQFHPEKSHKFGMKLFTDFLAFRAS